MKPFQITIIVHKSIIITANCNINSLNITEPHNGNIKRSISAVSSKLTLHMNRGYWLYVINTIFKTTMYFDYIVVVSFFFVGHPECPYKLYLGQVNNKPYHIYLEYTSERTALELTTSAVICIVYIVTSTAIFHMITDPMHEWAMDNPLYSHDTASIHYSTWLPRDITI
jgi:hypothetical protein